MRYCLILIWIIFSEFQVQSQTAGEAYLAGLRCLRSGKTDSAVMLFQRSAYFAENGLKREAWLMLGKTLVKRGDYHEALRAFDEVHSIERDSLEIESVYGKSLCYLSLQQPEMALAELNIFPDSSKERVTRRFYIYCGSAFFNMDETDSAEKYFLLAANKDSVLKTGIVKAFDNISKFRKRYRPAKYVIWSIFIPGMGQLLLGETGQGLNSFVLNASLITIMLINSINYSFFDTFLAITPWFVRYYAGGIIKTRNLAKTKLDLKIRNEYNLILDSLAVQSN